MTGARVAVAVRRTTPAGYRHFLPIGARNRDERPVTERPRARLDGAVRGRRIEVYAEVVCPFAHVGLRRLVRERAARGCDAPVRVRAWPLEWVNGRAVDPALVAREVDALRETVAPDLFTGFDPSVFPPSSIPAFGLAAAAYAIDDATGEAVSLAVRDALFEDGADVSDREVLRDIGAPWGVVPLQDDAAIAAVEGDYTRGAVRGVRGSPHFFVGTDDWFCPTLTVHHDDGHFVVHPATDRMERFYAVALGAPTREESH
jgi:predicted DsbA family dithiol-disulfide isomerase